jgi:hypothetical protein
MFQKGAGRIGLLAMLSFVAALGTATPARGDCSYDCYDGNPCTYDGGTSINGLCVDCDNDDKPNGTPCATPPGTCAQPGTTSRCLEGRCTPYVGSPPCGDDGNPCTYNRCEVKGCTGPKSYPKKPAGTSCKDFTKENGVIVARNNCTTSGYSGKAKTCNSNGVCGRCRTEAGCALFPGPWGGANKYCRPVISPTVVISPSIILDDGEEGCQ